MKQKMTKVQYREYHFTKKEYTIFLLKGMGIITCVSYLFYRSYIAFVLLLPYLYIYLKKQKKNLKAERLEKLNIQFKDGIQAVLAALDVGYSMENAFIEARKDLLLLYQRENDMTREFYQIARGLQMNETIEELLKDLADRSGLEDVKSFAEVFIIAKRSGGDMLLIIRSTVQIIRDKTEVKQEIQTMMSGKRLEQSVMNIVPFGILFYVNLTSKGFLDVLYKTPTGIVVMTGCLVVYAISLELSERIVNVEV